LATAASTRACSPGLVIERATASARALAGLDLLKRLYILDFIKHGIRWMHLGGVT
jgi:hypothetical protein